MVPATPLRHLLTLTVLGAGVLLLWVTRPRFDASLPGAQNGPSCLNNLRQISRAYALYARDFDGKIALAVDPEDRFNRRIWAPRIDEDTPYQNYLQNAPFLHVVLRPYVDSAQVFHCPADTGWTRSRLNYQGLPDVRPSSFAKYGTSYYSWTIYGFNLNSVADIENPARKTLLFDGDLWHGNEANPRAGELFIDGHAEYLSQAQHEAFGPARDF